MKKKRLSLLSFALCICLLFNSLILTPNIYAYDLDDSQISNTTILDDYTEEYGLTENTDIKTLNPKSEEDTTISNAPTSINPIDIKYLAVLIEFPDIYMKDIALDSPYALQAGKMISSEGGKILTSDGEFDILSVKDYFNLYSYGKYDINMDYFPKNSQGKVISHITSQPRGYYMPKSSTNTIGYTTSEERLTRESELFNEAVSSIKSTLEKTYTLSELDTNNDGYIDSINFFLESPSTNSGVEYGDLLWSHKIDNKLSTTVAGLYVGHYNVIDVGDPSEAGGVLSYIVDSNNKVKLNYAPYSVIIHEFLHTLGVYDLYRLSTGSPVGIFDIMADHHPTNPQSLLTIHSREVLKWGDPIPTLSANTKAKIYKPKYKNDNEKTSYKITSKLNSDEYFIIEYYDKPENISNSGREDGLIIYRVNTTVSNNLEGSSTNPSKDFVYIFRPNENYLGEANSTNIKNAVLDLDKDSTYGKSLEESNSSWDNETIYFSDGSNSGIKLEILNITEDYIEIKYTSPEVNGKGTYEEPYLINNADEWNKYVKSNNYVKLTQDINFSGKTINSEDISNVTIHGNGKTIYNINITNKGGLFNSINGDSTINNLTIENINIQSNNDFIGALAGEIKDGYIQNVNIKSGTIKGTSGSEALGGFVGKVSGGVIEKCSTAANVSNGDIMGGFVGIADSGTLKHNTSSGTVTYDSDDTAGGFYGSGSNAIFNNNLFEIRNNLSTANSSKKIDGIDGILLPDKLIIDLSKSDSVNFSAQMYSTSTNKTTLSFVDFLIANPSIATLVAEENKIKGLRVGETSYSTNITLGNARLYFTRPIEVLDTSLILLKEIQLSEESLELKVGDTKNDIKVTYIPNNTNVDKTVSWTSSDTSVAKVDANGKITAVGIGTATIKAIASGKYDTITVKVNSSKNEALSINLNDFNLTKGKTKDLNASLLTDNNSKIESLSWHSNNNDVATVNSNGLVTGVNPGVATITATAKIGSKTFTDSVNVTVTPLNIDLQSISLSKTSLTLDIGSKSTVNVIYNPSNTTVNKNITWSSSDNSIAKVSNGTITAVGSGTAYITAKVGNKTARLTVNVNAPKLYRLGGSDRYETAKLINNQMDSKTLILVTSTNFADALSATSLIKNYNGEIHLVGGSLDSNTIASLKKGEFSNAIIVGGEGVVSSSVEKTVKSYLGNNSVIRLAGNTRYETSAAVASHITKYIGKTPYAFAVTGQNFADALSVAPIAAMTGSPIVLTEGTTISQAGAVALKNTTNHFYKIGGPTVVGNKIDSIVGTNYKRIYGEDRYDTNVKIINSFYELFTGNIIFVATGQNFPDSLAGSALAGKSNAPILFVSNVSTEETKALVKRLNKANIIALGGPGVVSDSVMNSLR